MKHKLLTVIGSLLIIGGLGIFLYPDIANLLHNADSQARINEFEEYYSEPDTQNAGNGETEIPDAEETADAENTETSVPYQELLNAILAYNQEIYVTDQADFRDAWSYTQSPVNIDSLENDLFGYIEIPSMDITLPLYIGASTENMAQGAAVMGQTSIPIGGINTNSVIAGHRGYRGSLFFREIEKIDLGDYIYITNPWETLVYQAVEIRVIDPYDYRAVKIQEGRDLVTLLTCHPYASGGRYRYLVYCERVQSDQSDAPSLPENYTELNETRDLTAYGYVIESSQGDIDFEVWSRRAGAALILLILLFVVVKKIRDRVKERQRIWGR